MLPRKYRPTNLESVHKHLLINVYLRTFDNRPVGGPGPNQKHECHHHNVHAYGTIHRDEDDFRCGSMSDPVDMEMRHCRFEFKTDVPGRQFIQTHNSGQCKSKNFFLEF
jgi:hypothetical protein